AGEYNIVWSEENQKGSFQTPDEANTLYDPDPGFSFLRIDVIDQCFAMGFVGPYLGVVDAEDTLRTIDLSRVPNVITPNNDGRNDYFAVEGIDVFPGSLLQVWDRWGAEVFESDDYNVVQQESGRPSNAFGGEDRNDGSYFFVLNVNSGECVKTGYIEILGSNPPRVRR
ncbi:MAG: gliding motility-associated C-terminal domain-containing protein, partial [Flavobacteriales bacterium]|nr:gliding motility-associated C-terminal domain-containing protein [Flavobacteriales bacterium]